jgi:hypothetical protein
MAQKKANKKRPRTSYETLLLVGTVKGAFIFRSKDRKTWTRSGVLFPGMQVYALCHDPRSGRLLAGVSHPYFGTNVRNSDDLGKTWIEPKEANIKFPEDAGLVRSDVSATEPHKAKLDNVWQLVPGLEPNRIWAGVQPAALFRSDDGGKTFEMVRTLWDHPHRRSGTPEPAACACTRSCRTRPMGRRCTSQSRRRASTAPTTAAVLGCEEQGRPRGLRAGEVSGVRPVRSQDRPPHGWSDGGVSRKLD